MDAKDKRIKELEELVDKNVFQTALKRYRQAKAEKETRKTQEASPWWATRAPRQLRELLPEERVNETVDYEIFANDIERLGLVATGEFETIQHIELPESPVYVTNHRLTVYQDAQGNCYLPDVPELSGPIFGPRLLATIGWMKSVGHCCYSTVETWMEDVLQVPVSRGYLAKLCTGIISDSLKETYEELVEAIPQQEQLGSDETSHKDNGKKHWFWCITAVAFSVFHIAKTRSREVLEKLVGEEFAG